MKPSPTDLRSIRASLGAGARKGVRGFAWVMRILVPISLLTALLVWSGWLARGQDFIQPAKAWLSLPVEAAPPLLIGTTTGIYGAIAAMALLPLSKAHMTLIAIFLLIAHGLIQESVVQGKSGLNPFKAAAIRLAAATATILLVAPFLDIPAAAAPAAAGPWPDAPPFTAMLLDWLQVTALLAAKVFVIIMGVMVFLELLKTLGWIHRIVAACRPLLRLMGLSPRTGTIWMTASVFGLLYGAAVIVEETRDGSLSAEERTRLQVSIGINHAVIEDPALFLSCGLNPFWLWVPRLLAAVVAVRVFDLWQALRRRRPARATVETPR